MTSESKCADKRLCPNLILTIRKNAFRERNASERLVSGGGGGGRASVSLVYFPKFEIASHAFPEISPPYAEAQAGLYAGICHSGITENAGKHTPPYASLQAGYAA
jgi:hypothetical protein